MKSNKSAFPSLRFPNFKDEWKKAKFHQIFELKYGKDYRENKPGSIPVYGSGGIMTYTDRHLYNKPSVLLGRKGSINSPKFVDEPFWTVDTMFYTIIKETFSPFFVFHLVKNINWVKYNEATGVPSLNTKGIYSVKSFYPSIPEQQKIAAFLAAVDKKIQQLTRKKELLQKYKKGLMQKIFSQEIRFKDDNGQEFPDWELKKLSDFLKLTLREVEKPDKEFLAIGIRSHCKGTFQKPNFHPEKIEMEKLYKVKEGDLVVNITFAWEGAIALVKAEDHDGLVSHRFPTYTFNESKVLKEFFKYVFVTNRFVFWLGMISPGGAGRNRVMNRKDFLKLKVMIPKLAEQKKISEFLISLDKKIALTDNQLAKAKEFKKGLLQQMFV